MERLSFTSEQIESVILDEGWGLDRPYHIIATNRGSVVRLSSGAEEFILKYADLGNYVTEAGIYPSRSEGIRNEASILSILSNDIGPVLYSHAENAESVYSLTRYVEGDTLGGTTEREGVDLQSLIRSLLGLMINLHEDGILHGDIKPDNYILPPNDSMFLLDFEFSHGINDQPIAPGFVHYMSPESARREMNQEQFLHDQQEETFAVAATILSIITGSLPAKYPTQVIPARSSAMRQIAEGAEYNSGAKDNAHAKLAKSLKRILENSPEKRPDCPACLYDEVERFL